jgi:hypothetical protein
MWTNLQFDLNRHKSIPNGKQNTCSYIRHTEYDPACPLIESRMLMERRPDPDDWKKTGTPSKSQHLRHFEGKKFIPA